MNIYIQNSTHEEIEVIYYAKIGNSRIVNITKRLTGWDVSDSSYTIRNIIPYSLVKIKTFSDEQKIQIDNCTLISHNNQDREYTYQLNKVDTRFNIIYETSLGCANFSDYNECNQGVVCTQDGFYSDCSDYQNDCSYYGHDGHEQCCDCTDDGLYATNSDCCDCQDCSEHGDYANNSEYNECSDYSQDNNCQNNSFDCENECCDCSDDAINNDYMNNNDYGDCTNDNNCNNCQDNN